MTFKLCPLPLFKLCRARTQTLFLDFTLMRVMSSQVLSRRHIVTLNRFLMLYYVMVEYFAFS